MPLADNSEAQPDQAVAVEQRHRDAAKSVNPAIVGFGGATGFNHISQAFARFERDHLAQPADAELVAALEPFARVADHSGSAWHDSRLLAQLAAPNGLTIGDCRRARDALARRAKS